MGGAAEEVVELAVAAAGGVLSPEGVQGGGGKVTGWHGCTGGKEVVDACAVGPPAAAVAVKAAARVGGSRVKRRWIHGRAWLRSVGRP